MSRKISGAECGFSRDCPLLWSAWTRWLSRSPVIENDQYGKHGQCRRPRPSLDSPAWTKLEIHRFLCCADNGSWDPAAFGISQKRQGRNDSEVFWPFPSVVSVVVACNIFKGSFSWVVTICTSVPYVLIQWWLLTITMDLLYLWIHHSSPQCCKEIIFWHRSNMADIWHILTYFRLAKSSLRVLIKIEVNVYGCYLKGWT